MRILVVVTSDHDTFAWYRHVQPFQAYQSYLKTCGVGSDFELTVVTAAGWKDLNDHDIVFVPKPSTADHVEILRLAALMGVPAVIDLDDNLLELRPVNPVYSDRHAIASHVDEALELATAITVSTEEVANVYRPLCQRHIEVIPPSIPEALLDRWKGKRTDRYRKVFYWRGGGAQIENLLHYRDDLRLVIDSVVAEDTLWIFAGVQPWPIQNAVRHPERILHLPWKDSIPEAFLQEVMYQPDAHLVLLQNNSFDNCRSETAYLEATMSSAYTIAPSWTSTWELPGTAHYGYADGSLHYILMEALVRSSSEEQYLQAKALEFVRKERISEGVGARLVNLLRRVYEARREAYRNGTLPVITQDNPLDRER
jgi:hypothetical protein